MAYASSSMAVCSATGRQRALMKVAMEIAGEKASDAEVLRSPTSVAVRCRGLRYQDNEFANIQGLFPVTFLRWEFSMKNAD